MNTCDFTCLMHGENSTAVSVIGLDCGGSVTINGSSQLSEYIRFNNGGCVYQISLEAAETLSVFRYRLRVDAQGPKGALGGAGYLYFMDASGDTYCLELISSTRKQHTLSYNSERPKIIAIVWSNNKK